MLIQRDTYFEVLRGRLKLREEPDAVAHLIEVPQPLELQEALAAVLSITVVVSKTRRLFIFDGVRIHLDRVDGLGDFIEFEGVGADGGDPGGFAKLLDDLRRSLGIRDEDLLSESYSDLLRSAGPA